MKASWFDDLDDDDRQFLKRFVLASGSLKDLAADYGISYPTVRARLDRLIAKVKAIDAAPTDDPFERRLRLMVADLTLAPAAAKVLLAAHRESLPRRNSS
jgi:hypothetical protein